MPKKQFQKAIRVGDKIITIRHQDTYKKLLELKNKLGISNMRDLLDYLMQFYVDNQPSN